MKLTNFYRGTVVQQLTQGFCKIAIPGILYFEDGNGNLDIDKLPPAECATSNFGGANENGVFQYPELYSTVWCFFENGDINKPIYFASAVNNATAWNSAKVAVQDQADIPGYSLANVTSVGKVSIFGETEITQTTEIDKNTKKPLYSKIELTVHYSPDNIDTKLEQSKMVDGKFGNALPEAAKIIFDNATNTLILTAANNLELRAPNIILNSQNLGAPSKVTIVSDDVSMFAENEISLINKTFQNKSTGVAVIKSPNELEVYE